MLYLITNAANHPLHFSLPDGASYHLFPTNTEGDSQATLTEEEFHSDAVQGLVTSRKVSVVPQVVSSEAPASVDNQDQE